MEKTASTIDAPEIMPSLAVEEKKVVPAPPSNPPAHTNETSLFNRIIRIAALPVSLASGYWAANAELYNAAREKLEKLKEIKVDGVPTGDNFLLADIARKYKPDFAELLYRKNKGQITSSEYRKELSQTITLQSKEINEAMKTVDMGKGFFEKGGGPRALVNRWNYVNSGFRQQAVTNGMMVTTAMLGAMFLMSEHKSVMEFLGFEDREKSNSPNILLR